MLLFVSLSPPLRFRACVPFASSFEPVSHLHPLSLVFSVTIVTVFLRAAAAVLVCCVATGDYMYGGEDVR